MWRSGTIVSKISLTPSWAHRSAGTSPSEAVIHMDSGCFRRPAVPETAKRQSRDIPARRAKKLSHTLKAVTPQRKSRLAPQSFNKARGRTWREPYRQKTVSGSNKISSITANARETFICWLTPELSRAVNGAATCASVANAHRRRNETASA